MNMKLTNSVHRIVAAVMTTVAMVCLTACSDNDDSDAPANATEMKLIVNGEHYDIALPATDAVDLVTLCREFDAEFQVENAAAFQTITIGGQPLQDGRCAFAIKDISKDTKIEIAYTTGDQQGTVTLNTLHSGIPEINASGRALIPGQFYLSFIYLRLIMKYDNSGNVIYYRYEPTYLAGTFSELGYWDFKKHVFDGKTYYSYHAPDPKYADLACTGYDPGMRVLMDDHYTPLDTIHALASRDGFLPDGAPLDGHDFYFYSPTHYIASASYVEREVDGQPLAVGYLQEVQDGEVVFDWWSTDHKNLKTWMDPFFGLERDYIHFNSMQVLADNSLLCSLRHLSSVVKIDRANDTGDILWRIDGTSLDDAQNFSGQHNATLLDDGTLTLFDNGNGHNPPVTRLLRLTIDPATGEVKGGGNILPDSYPTYFTQACGSFAKVGDYYVAGWGIPGSSEGPHDRLVTEMDAKGNEIFGIRLLGASYQENFLCATYRCLKK